MSYYVVEVNEIRVIGSLWWPSVTAAMCYRLGPDDIKGILEYGDGEITRKAAEKWLSFNSGDFQSIKDFQVDIRNFFSDWEDEESESFYCECMCPPEEVHG